MSEVAENPAEIPVGELVPQPHGGSILKGSRPGHGATGRPPNEFKARMRELVDNDAVEAYLQRCLDGEFGPKFFLAARLQAKEDGYGKAAQPLVGEDGVSPVKMVVEFVDPPDAG